MWENASLEAEIIKVIYKIRNKNERPDEDAIFECNVKNSATNITFQDIGAKGRYD